MKRFLILCVLKWFILGRPANEKLWQGGPPTTTSTRPFIRIFSMSASITSVPYSSKFHLSVSIPQRSLSITATTRYPASLNPWLNPPGAAKRSRIDGAGPRSKTSSPPSDLSTIDSVCQLHFKLLSWLSGLGIGLASKILSGLLSLLSNELRSFGFLKQSLLHSRETAQFPTILSHLFQFNQSYDCPTEPKKWQTYAHDKDPYFCPCVARWSFGLLQLRRSSSDTSLQMRLRFGEKLSKLLVLCFIV